MIYYEISASHAKQFNSRLILNAPVIARAIDFENYLMEYINLSERVRTNKIRINTVIHMANADSYYN